MSCVVKGIGPLGGQDRAVHATLSCVPRGRDSRVTVPRRPWANPLVQFVTASLLLFGVTWWATGIFSQRAARSEALADARITTELLAHSVAEPAMPKGLIAGDPGAIDRFDREVLARLLVGDVRRIKIWRSDGTIV